MFSVDMRHHSNERKFFRLIASMSQPLVMRELSIASHSTALLGILAFVRRLDAFSAVRRSIDARRLWMSMHFSADIFCSEDYPFFA
jgi:hypothetical protein